MATLTETQDAYDRHNLHVGVIHSDVADVILKLERQLRESVATIQAQREQIAALELERDALQAQLNRSIPDDFATLDEYIRTLHDENTLFTYQSAERGFLLRDMLASGEAHQEWIHLQAFKARIRLVLDSPEDAEKRERAVRRALLTAREGR